MAHKAVFRSLSKYIYTAFLMSKICPICHKKYEAGKFCLDCGISLIEDQPTQQQVGGGFSLNLGDANAISGGVNMSDNHSTNNNTVNTTTSNVDSHNVINTTNHITQIERENRLEETLLEGTCSLDLKNDLAFAFTGA